MSDDWVSLAQQVREAGDFEDDASIVDVIETVLRRRLDSEEASATEEEISEKQAELREKMTGGE